jgi:predicted TIM-barrel fold metal-dependent hydrolase
MYARPLAGIDPPESAENPYEQATAHFAAGQLGERVKVRLNENAARTRIPRRTFVKTACGFASALAAANSAAGMRVFDVDAAETTSADAAAQKNAAARPAAELIVDAHSHVCWRRDGFVLGKNTSERGMYFVDLIDGLGKSLGLKSGIRDMTVETFGKLVLEGSDTTVAIVNPFGFREDYGGKDMMPLDELAEVRERWPGRVILLGGGLSPNQGLSQTLERLAMYVEKFKISGLKLYTFDATPKRGWWFDDEKLAYPIWERCRKLGLRNIGCHKGLPFSHFSARHAHPTDMDQAAEDFADMNWLVFHSAYPYLEELSSFGRAYKPHRKNLYCELGSTFASLVTNQPVVCAHMLGTLLRDFGPDYVLWGTDSLLWGGPQWQIEAFRRFRIPDELVAGHGYPQLTPEVKRKILGENAARLWKFPLDAAKAAQPGAR